MPTKHAKQPNPESSPWNESVRLADFRSRVMYCFNSCRSRVSWASSCFYICAIRVIRGSSLWPFSLLVRRPWRQTPH